MVKGWRTTLRYSLIICFLSSLRICRVTSHARRCFICSLVYISILAALCSKLIVSVDGAWVCNLNYGRAVVKGKKSSQSFQSKRSFTVSVACCIDLQTNLHNVLDFHLAPPTKSLSLSLPTRSFNITSTTQSRTNDRAICTTTRWTASLAKRSTWRKTSRT
jgi:hypothetical protein